MFGSQRDRNRLVTCRIRHDYTPLQHACGCTPSYESTQTPGAMADMVSHVHILLAAGACVDSAALDTPTPLYAALHRRGVDAVAALLYHGAEPGEAHERAGRKYTRSARDMLCDKRLTDIAMADIRDLVARHDQQLKIRKHE
jgi:hypothetical protein